MATLMLRIAAPLQSWGSESKFNIRGTEREPTKSGIIGMIAAAMGIQREDISNRIEQLSKLRFGVRVEREGKLIKDFHMVHEYKKGKEGNSYITERYYLSDAVFLVALESDDKELLEWIDEALKNPVFPLFLGRRSCPPTLPIVMGLTDESLVDSLKKWHDLVENDTGYKRLTYESIVGGRIIHDIPVSFSQLHRKHEYRYKKEEIMVVNKAVLAGNEHDPMAEL